MRALMLRGIVIVLAITALLAAGELAFRADPVPDVRAAAALLSALAAAGLLVFQQLYFGDRERVERYRRRQTDLEAEADGLRSHIEALERDRRVLRQQVESLSAHRELSRAATAHTSFEDFLDEIAGVVHDLAAARDLTVFVTNSASSGPLPRAYYRLSRATELCLSLTDTGGLTLMNEMETGRQSDGAIDAELLDARRLSITPRGAQVVVAGTLMFRQAEVGLMRLTLYHLDADDLPATDAIESLVAAELGQVRLDNRNVLEAMVHQKPMQYDAQARLVDLACPLVAETEQIGVVKVRFDCHGEDQDEQALAERQQLLAESAGHIARAVRSERLYVQAIRDGLTGLYNKQYMMTQLEGYFRIARRHPTHLSLILVDLDHFKQVNDTHGHLTGDKILREIAAILADSIRDADLACRYGGEELAVILPEGSLQGSTELAERLREGIEAHAFASEGGEPVPLTASLGVAEFLPSMRRIEDLIAHADAALYRAKAAGRNRAVAWSSEDGVLNARGSTRRRPAARRRPQSSRTPSGTA